MKKQTRGTMNMEAWMVINGYLKTNKFKELDYYLEDAAKKQGIVLTVYYNFELPICYGMKKELYFKQYGLKQPDFVLFWDKDVRLAKWLESLGLSVFNSAESIALCDDKSATHQRLSAANIPMPQTIMAPFTYENIGYTEYNFLSYVIEELGFPIVIKECFGSFGAQVYLTANEQQLNQKVQEIGSKPMLFQKFISESAGHDIRLQVVGKKVITAMERYSEDGDFRANISNGGKMKPYQVNKEEEELAIRCCELLGLTFGGVDLLLQEGKKRLVCEVNSNAHFKNIYLCTGVNVAEAMIECMKKIIFSLES